MRPDGPSPLLGLVAALAVLVAGIAAAAAHDDESSVRSDRSIVGPTSTPSTVATTTTAAPVPTGPTFNTLPPTSPTTLPPTTVRPANPTPEGAVNGLMAAYASGNRAAAARFASEPVVEALFAEADNGEAGAFQGCTQVGDGLFSCRYDQTTKHYVFTAEADRSGNFTVVVIEITS